MAWFYQCKNTSNFKLSFILLYKLLHGILQTSVARLTSLEWANTDMQNDTNNEKSQCCWAVTSALLELCLTNQIRGP